MPSGVETLPSAGLLPPQTFKPLPPKTDDGDSFKQVLKNSTSKSQSGDSQDDGDSASSSTAPPTQSAGAKKPAKHDDQSENEDSDQIAQASSESQRPTAKVAIKQATQIQPTNSKPQPASTVQQKPTKTDDKSQADKTSDNDAINAAVQAAVASPPQALTNTQEKPEAEKTADQPATVVRAPQKSAVKSPVQENVNQTNVQQTEDDAQDGAENNGNADEQNDDGELAQTAVATKSVKDSPTPQAKQQNVQTVDQDQTTVKAEETAKKVVAPKPVDPAVDQSLQAVSAIAGDATSAPTPQTKTAAQPSDVIDPALAAKPQANSQTIVAKQAPVPPAPTPQADFAAANHDKIVTSVRTQLLPNGGSMQIRLDPPEMGQVQLTVRMNDGVMSASFETSNDQATKMLSHSLGQLKTALETTGVSVGKLHVQQSPRDEKSGSSSDEQKQQTSKDGQSSQREQQRKEMLRRMWAKLGVGDPLDLVA